MGRKKPVSAERVPSRPGFRNREKPVKLPRDKKTEKKPLKTERTATVCVGRDCGQRQSANADCTARSGKEHSRPLCCELRLFAPAPVVTGAPEVCLTLGPCFGRQKIYLRWRAAYDVITNPPLVRERTLETTTDRYGNFGFSIPTVDSTSQDGNSLITKTWSIFSVCVRIPNPREGCHPACLQTTYDSSPEATLFFQRKDQEDYAMLCCINRHAVDTSGLDHIPPPRDIAGRQQEQLGPCKAARAMAIVHIAIFETLIAIHGGYHSYLGLPRVTGTTSAQAAMAQAAFSTLVALFPSQEAGLRANLLASLGAIANGPAKQRGVVLGQQAAAAILARRAADGSAASTPEPRLAIAGGPIDTHEDLRQGQWRQDPVTRAPVAMGAYWNQVTPFIIPSATTYRAPPPPAFNSPQFAMAYNEEKAMGGDGTVTPTVRSTEDTYIGTYWAYDGTPSLCAPPRLYNEIAMTVAQKEGLALMETARLLAVLNVAMADAAIACWDSKYHYHIGRPVTLIRDVAANPAYFNNSGISGDSTWRPLGAPASNTNGGADFTPPFPSYPSGHGTFGGALFQTLRHFLGRDNIPFTFVSDEYNGATTDIHGNVRPLIPRQFTSFSQAEEENGQSRIFLGIHWNFDKTAAITMGRHVADDVFAHLYTPL